MKAGQKFIEFTNRSAPEFSLLKDIMHLKSEHERFLNFMNNALNDIEAQNLSTSKEGAIHGTETPRVTIFHIPHCPEEYRDILMQYIIYRSALFQNRTTSERFFRRTARPVYGCGNTSKHKLLKLIDTYHHLKNIRKKLDRFEREGFEIPEGTKKALLIIRNTDYTSLQNDQHAHINEYMADLNSISDPTRNLLVTTNESHDLISLIKDIRQKEEELLPTIERVFLFHSPNRMNVLKSYNIDQLRRLNAYGLGIKHLIIFSLTDKPLNLYKAIENRKRRFLTAIHKKNMHRYNESDAFISFTGKELRYLFKRQENQRTFLANVDEAHLFTSDMEQLLDDISTNYKIRNQLALAFRPELQEKVASILLKESRDFNRDEYRPYFAMLNQLWSSRIQGTIDTFLSDCNMATFVVSNDTPGIFKDALKEVFGRNCSTITFCSMDEITTQEQTDKFVVLQYRSANSWYKFYPNSFDPLPIAPNQQALVVVNMLTHGRQYDWDNLDYRKAYNGLLYSRFRVRNLDWKRREFSKPEYDLREFIDAEYNDMSTRNYQRKKCTVHYTNNTTKEYDVSDRVIYEINDRSYIEELRYLSEYTNFRMELLDDVVNQVKILINEKTRKNGDAEHVIRADPKYGLTLDEIHSTEELWKILLRKRIGAHGEDEVYDTIFEKIPADEQVSKLTFRRWYIPEVEMILPRSRKHRRALLEYLGFTPDSRYYRLVIAKKLTNINDTRSLNSQVENMLKEILFIKEVTDQAYDALSEKYADLFMLLEVSSSGGIQTLRELIDVDFDEVKKIEYGQE